MNPDTRMATSLVLSLLVSANNLRLAVEGRADIVTVGVRYAVGFVLCFILVGIVGRLYNVYLAELEERRGADDPQPASPDVETQPAT